MPGAVLDAVDAGVDQAGQRVLAEHVRGDPGAVGVGGVDGLLEHVVGPQRREVADAAVDPVADQLDPAVAPPGLLGHRVGQLRLVLESIGEPGLVALGPGEVAACADDARQVVAVVEAAGVDRRAGVAQQQRAGVTLGFGLGDRLVEFDGAVLAEADVAVRVDQAGQDPAAVAPKTVSASATGSALSMPSTIHHSTGSPSGSPRPLHVQGAHATLLLAGELQLRQVDVGEPGRQLVEALGHVRQVGEAGGHAAAPSGLRTFGGVGPRPPFLPSLFLPLAALRCRPLRPNGMPI